jgi:hypothetical protein
MDERSHLLFIRLAGKLTLTYLHGNLPDESG